MDPTERDRRLKALQAGVRAVGGGRGPERRTRPGKQSLDLVQLLRDLRKSTRQYLLILESALAALPQPMETDEAPEVTLLRSMLRVASGARGVSYYGFGTPAALEEMLTRALGEGETT